MANAARCGRYVRRPQQAARAGPAFSKKPSSWRWVRPGLRLDDRRVSIGPSTEANRRGVRIDDPDTERLHPVPEPVLEDVEERVPDRGRTLEIATVMTVGPDLAPAPQSTIELPREGDRQPADAAPESLPLLLRTLQLRALTDSAGGASIIVCPLRQARLDDQVKVVALDREVNDLELGGVWAALRLRLQHVSEEVPH